MRVPVQYNGTEHGWVYKRERRMELKKKMSGAECSGPGGKSTKFNRYTIIKCKTCTGAVSVCCFFLRTYSGDRRPIILFGQLRKCGVSRADFAPASA